MAKILSKNSKVSLKKFSLGDLFGSESKWAINKRMAKLIGLSETVLLIELMDIWDTHKGKSFFVSRSELEELTGFSPSCQKSYEDKLIKLNFISRKLKGIPPNNRYKMKKGNIDRLIKNPKKYLVKLGVIHEEENS